MAARKTYVYLALAFLVCFILGMVAACSTRGAFRAQPTPEPIEVQIEDAIEEAFELEVAQNQQQVLGFMVYDVVIDHIEYSVDQSTALLWLALLDPETGEVIASEPGLSIAQSGNPTAMTEANNWAITLQNAGNWTDQLQAIPPELLTEDIRSRYLDPASIDPPDADAQTAVAQVLTGYRLPWTAGLSKRVTNTIGHVYTVSGGLTSCPSTCRYAYDFADGTMFPLIAAKGGTVKAVKWSCPNYGESCTNYLILEDQSTIPTSYQVYYHLAYNTVPQRLRNIGEPVSRGEYIGDTDDTGYSTGHHLHYHVYTSRTQSNWSWGYSVDFVFEDVAQNGGHPRTCAEASQYSQYGSECMTNNRYVSGNTPAFPPTATFTTPVDRQVIPARTVRVTGTASDDIQIVRVQVLANWNGTWNTIDDIIPAGNGPYAKDVDLCAAGVPDGPFAMTVRVYDREGSMASGLPVRQLIKNSNCTGSTQPPAPPACTPAADEVALYSEKDFRGSCSKFKVNNNAGYTATQLGAVGDNNAASLQVGSSVRAILYDRSGDVPAVVVSGRIETFEANDASLSENLIGVDRVSGIWVANRTMPPDEPFINPIGHQLSSAANPTSVDSLVLSWEGGAGATSFDVTLSGPGANWTRNVTGTNHLSIGSLPAGSYSMSVRAKNSAGSNGSDKSFTVTSGSLPAVTARVVPYLENLEANNGGWISSGLWRYGTVDAGGRASTKAWIYNNGTNYSDAVWRASDLISPPITLPATGVYYLRFSYFAEVESGERHWDQRRVQISANDGPFTDLHLLTDDKQANQTWLNSGPISLSAYAGKKIRIRFHFNTVDEDLNTTRGWMVDDISINNQAPDTSCADGNNSPSTAQTIALGGSTSTAICPERDVDYYKFTAKAGQPIIVDINARSLSPASLLNSHVSLLDSDQRSVLAENNDEQANVVLDSLLLYTIQRDGTYYLKVRAWDHPGVGSKAHTYQLVLNNNITLPPSQVNIAYPTANRKAPVLPFEIEVQAADYDGGQVAQVDFYWHGPDWNVIPWTKLGSDANPSDGWSMRVDPAVYGGMQGSAIYVQAYGRMGGVLGSALWDLEPDTNSPVTKLNPLSAQTYSTVIRLGWSASDVQNDIDRFEIQYQVNSGSGWTGWQNYTGRSFPAGVFNTWFNGVAGYSYRFRLRGIDRAVNIEAYPDVAESATTISATCTPDSAESSGNTMETAFSLTRKTTSGQFNFCKSSQAGAGAGDVDWMAIDLVAGEKLLVMVIPKSGGAAFSVSLYNASKTRLVSWQSPDYGMFATVRWVPPTNGKYYLEVKPLKPDLFGTDVRYVVSYPGNVNFLPIIASGR